MTSDPRPHTCFDYERIGACVVGGLVVTAVLVTIIVGAGIVALAVGVVALVAGWICYEAFPPDPIQPAQEHPESTEEQRFRAHMGA